MPSVATYTKSGTKATSAATIDKNVFGEKVENHELLKLAYSSYLAGKRRNLAIAKTRGEVRGGGKKPWRQKGTGRARFGSSRVPIWRGGGITFGPTGNENYQKKLPTTMKRLALRQALSIAYEDNKIIVVETFSYMDGKTKDMAKFLDKIAAKGRILCVVSKLDPSKERAARNIPDLKVIGANYLNVFDVLNADTIVISKKSLDIIKDWLSSSHKASENKRSYKR
jgi:large subunit ribosomal protein L4